MGGKKDDEKGIIPRLVESIFQGIEEAEVGIEFTVKLSYVEIYSQLASNAWIHTARGDAVAVRHNSSSALTRAASLHG